MRVLPPTGVGALEIGVTRVRDDPPSPMRRSHPWTGFVPDLPPPVPPNNARGLEIGGRDQGEQGEQGELSTGPLARPLSEQRPLTLDGTYIHSHAHNSM